MGDNMSSPAVADTMFVPSGPIHSYPVSAAGHSEIRMITLRLLLVPTPRPTSIPAGTGLAPIGDIEPCHTRQRSGISVRDCYLRLNFTGIKYTYRPLSLT